MEDKFYKCYNCRYAHFPSTIEPCLGCEKSRNNGGTNHKTAGEKLPDCYNCFHNTVCGLRKSLDDLELPEYIKVTIECDAFCERN